MLWTRDPINSGAIAVITNSGLLIDVFTEMVDEVNNVLASRIAVCVENPKTEVAVGIDDKTDLGHVVILRWSSLGTADWATLVGVAEFNW